MPDIIYPMLQKYYNALNSLNSLNIAKDIYESIPLIDNFFAEFRTESVACPISIGGMEAVLKQFGFYTI